MSNASSPCEDGRRGAVLEIYVQPKASRSACVGTHGHALKIRIAAPPVNGAANEELLRFLSSELSLPVAAVRIESGTRSRHKRIRVTGMSAVEVLTRLLPDTRQR